MRQALEGSQAIARAVALCRPEVIAAYPITPQTHIVENIAKLVADGKLVREFVSVESEFSAASVVLGAAAAGARTYTASASQGILLMSEVLFNIAGHARPAGHDLRQPRGRRRRCRSGTTSRIPWRCATPAGSSSTAPTTRKRSTPRSRPSASPSDTELPVMVCMDGFTLTHTLEADRHARRRNRSTPSCRPIDFARTLDPRQADQHGHAGVAGFLSRSAPFAPPGAAQARWTRSWRPTSTGARMHRTRQGGLVTGRRRRRGRGGAS